MADTYGYGLVARLLSAYWALHGPEGRLPAPAWALALRSNRLRRNAVFEMSAAYRLDLEAGLQQLDADSRALLQARFLAGLPLYKIGRQRGRLSSREVQVLIDGAIEQLVELMNRGGNGTMPKDRSVSDADTTLPKGPDSQEQELYRVFDCLERKLNTLPAVPWRSVTISRTSQGYDCRVTV